MHQINKHTISIFMDIVLFYIVGMLIWKDKQNYVWLIFVLFIYWKKLGRYYLTALKCHLCHPKFTIGCLKILPRCRKCLGLFRCLHVSLTDYSSFVHFLWFTVRKCIKAEHKLHRMCIKCAQFITHYAKFAINGFCHTVLTYLHAPYVIWFARPSRI